MKCKSPSIVYSAHDWQQSDSSRSQWPPWVFLLQLKLPVWKEGGARTKFDKERQTSCYRGPDCWHWMCLIIMCGLKFWGAKFLPTESNFPLHREALCGASVTWQWVFKVNEAVASLSLFNPTLHFVWSNFEAMTSNCKRLQAHKFPVEAAIEWFWEISLLEGQETFQTVVYCTFCGTGSKNEKKGRIQLCKVLCRAIIKVRPVRALHLVISNSAASEAALE